MIVVLKGLCRRGLVKALGAATVGSESNKHAFLPHEDSEKHEKHIFRHLGVGLRRSHGSDHREGH